MAPEYDVETILGGEILSQKAKRALAGALIVLAFIAIGIHTRLTSGSITDISLWNSIFIGLGFGHYFSKALESSSLINYFLTGAFAIMSLYELLGSIWYSITWFSSLNMLSIIGYSSIHLAMISLSLTVFLKHRFNLVENHKIIDSLVNLLAGKVAIGYLVLVNGATNFILILGFLMTLLGYDVNMM